MTNNVSLGLRTEFFDEYNHGVNAIGLYSSTGSAYVMDLTLSGQIKCKAITFIPEIRMDKTSKETFTRAADGAASSKLISVNFAFIYAIPTFSIKAK